MLPNLLVPLALALGVAAHGAVAPAERVQADSTAVANRDQPVTIHFENQGYDLATVYAVPMSGIAVRLGQVTPGATAKFVVPRAVVSGPTTVNFVAVPFARNFATRSGPVAVAPGDVFDLALSASENAVSVLPGR
jgi:hypothetical protein